MTTDTMRRVRRLKRRMWLRFYHLYGWDWDRETDRDWQHLAYHADLQGRIKRR